MAFFNSFRGTFADQQIMVAADIRNNRFVHFIAADTDRTGKNNIAQSQNRDFGRAPADIDNHRPGRFGYRQTGADRRRHRFLNQKYFARAAASADS